jgi:hypothetical protein
MKYNVYFLKNWNSNMKERKNLLQQQLWIKMNTNWTYH